MPYLLEKIQKIPPIFPQCDFSDADDPEELFRCLREGPCHFPEGPVLKDTV